MRQNSFFMKKIGILMLTLLLLFSLGGCSSDDEEIDNRPAIPFASSDIEKANFEVVVKQLKDAGFTNVDTLEIDGLVLGFFTKDGEVETMTINGKEGFSEGEKFDANTNITISYHTYPEKKAEKPEEEIVDKPEDENEELIEEKPIEEPSEIVPEVDYTEVNEFINEDLVQAQGWALGLLDRDGKPTENGTPSESFAFALFVQKITYLGDKLRVDVDPSFNQLSDEDKTNIANTVQNMTQSRTNDITYTTFFINGNAIGNSKITNTKAFKWK